MTWTATVEANRVPQDTGLRVDVGEHRIALFRIGDDVYALGDRCSHAEASLAEGEVFDTEVECPRHGARFDIRNGDAVRLPAVTPVPWYETRVEGDALYVEAPEPW